VPCNYRPVFPSFRSRAIALKPFVTPLYESSLTPPRAFASSGMQTVSDLEPTPNLLRAWADNHVRHSKLEDGMILPLLTYAAQIWFSGLKGLLDKCSKAKNAAIRHISGAFSGFHIHERAECATPLVVSQPLLPRYGPGPATARALCQQTSSAWFTLTYLISQKKIEKDPLY
jgi:hypothetical protein